MSCYAISLRTLMNYMSCWCFWSSC